MVLFFLSQQPSATKSDSFTPLSTNWVFVGKAEYCSKYNWRKLTSAWFSWPSYHISAPLGINCTATGCNCRTGKFHVHRIVSCCTLAIKKMRKRVIFIVCLCILHTSSQSLFALWFPYNNYATQVAVWWHEKRERKNSSSSHITKCLTNDSLTYLKKCLNFFWAITWSGIESIPTLML